MTELQTKYGMLRGVHQVVLGSLGHPEVVFLTEPNLLRLPMATWVPLHRVEDHGRRRETPLLFYPNGAIRSLPLQASTLVSFSCGKISAELVTFYPTGEIRRVFPNAGKLSGYWTEDQEYEHARVCEIHVNGVEIRAKIINLHFFKSGALQSITFWPKENVSIPLHGVRLEIRSGISFYENGRIKSYEPAEPILVDTPIGKIMAYDNHPLGVSADVNSLQFGPEGMVSGVTTVSSVVRVYPADSMPAEFAPYKVQSFCEEADTELRPLIIRFQQDQVVLEAEVREAFPLLNTQFEIIQRLVRAPASCCGAT